jgi:hypothetical protein
MAGCASSRAVEVLLASLEVSGLEICDIDTLTVAFFRECVILLGMNKSREAGNLPIRKIEAWHALLRASLAYYGADLVSIHIRGHHLGARKIRPALSTAGIPTMAKGAILLKDGASILDQSGRV